MSAFGLLGKGPERCTLCFRRRAVIGWCDPCRKSYMAMLLNGDGAVLTTVNWAIKRARRFALLEAARKAGGKKR